MRMEAGIPKQFLPLNKRPLLSYSIEAFSQVKPDLDIYLVMHPDFKEAWKDLCLNYRIEFPCFLVDGGENRTESVFNGLKAIALRNIDSPPEFIAIHDGVRPIIRPLWIEMGFKDAQLHGSSIPCIPLKDSLRILTNNGSQSVNRELYKIVQTPQIFPFKELYQAYLRRKKESYSDDATLFEDFDHSIYLSSGHQENLKITYPSDLGMAEFLLNRKD